MKCAEKAMKMIGLEKTQDNYQLIYKIEKLLIEECGDSAIIDQVKKRDLMPLPKCGECEKTMEASGSMNDVLDQWYCPDCD
jgi:hypothetical protein